MIRDGTSIHGENHPNATITKETAQQIRESKGQGTQKERAERFGASVSIVANIDSGFTWNEPGQPSKIKRKPVSQPTPEEIAQWLPIIESKCTKVPVDPDDDILKTTSDPGVRDHWIWNLSKNEGGYPRMNLYHLNCRTQRAHRATLMSHSGRVFDEHELVRHLCAKGELRVCCNPLHLAVGDYGLNAQDTIEHGKSGKGEKHPHAKLTEKEVIEIRRRCGSGESQTSLASEYEVSPSTINGIIKRKSWKHVD